MSKVTLVEQVSTPSAPPAGQHTLYADANGFRERTPTDDRSISRADASQAEAEAGTASGTRNFSPIRVKQAIQALQLGATGQSVFMPASDSGTRGSFSVLSVPTNGVGNFVFHVPDQIVTITAIQLICIPTAGAAGASRDIDFYSDYGTLGEAFNIHSEADTTSVFDLSSQADKLMIFDITSVLSNVQPLDFVGITVDHNMIGGSIDYLGVDVHYNLI